MTALESPTVAEDDDELTFEKPGPGTWELDDAHFSRPFSRWMQEVFPPAMKEGFGKSMAEYGALLDEPEVEPVNGFMYMSLRSVVGPAEASDPPPKLLFKLLTWVHPTLRRRLARMEETFETKRWRRDLERWDDEWKPDRIETNRRLQAVDPASLDDEELADHLVECRQAVSDAVVMHHRMDLCTLLPMGDFLNHALGWTDRSAGELLGLFDGESPISVGAVDELQRFASAIDDDGEARETLFSDASPGVIIDDLRDRDDAVGRAVTDWLDVVGYRVMGYDVADLYAREKPAVLVSTLRAAAEGEFDPTPAADAADELASIRNEVPATHREEFDERYEEARLTYRVRDERTLHDLWTAGLTRRAILAAGRRLTERGQLREPDHAVDLTPDELVAALRGAESPPPEEVAARVEYRRSHDHDDAPDRLGPEPPPAPPAEWLPDSAARGMRAIETMIEHMMESSEQASEGNVVHGLGASNGIVEGSARLVSGPEDFDRIREGDVLVTESTSPAFNVVLPQIDGVVTDYGGVLSHAAIVAREYDIPGVVGCNDATDSIDDGTRVVLDGEEGTVRILS